MNHPTKTIAAKTLLFMCVAVFALFVACEPEPEGSDGTALSDGSTWAVATTGADFPARFGHTSVVFNNRIWVIGGVGSDKKFKNDVWSSEDGKTWTPVLEDNTEQPTTQFSAREGHTGVAFKKKIWVIGGNDADGGKNDVWSSSDGETWTQVLPNNPKDTKRFSRRDGHTGVAHNGKMWVIGGYDRATTLPSLKNDVWSSEDGKTWTPVLEDNTEQSTTQFSARSGHTGVAHDGKIWVIGGYGGGSTFKNDVWSSEDGKTWTPVLDNNPKDTGRFSARSGHTGVAYGEKIWVIGGWGGGSTLKNDVWSSEDGETWTQVLENNTEQSTTQFPARKRHTSVVYSGTMWVIGGNKNDVWFAR